MLGAAVRCQPLALERHPWKNLGFLSGFQRSRYRRHLHHSINILQALIHKAGPLSLSLSLPLLSFICMIDWPQPRLDDEKMSNVKSKWKIYLLLTPPIELRMDATHASVYNSYFWPSLGLNTRPCMGSDMMQGIENECILKSYADWKWKNLFKAFKMR